MIACAVAQKAQCATTCCFCRAWQKERIILKARYSRSALCYSQSSPAKWEFSTL